MTRVRVGARWVGGLLPFALALLPSLVAAQLNRTEFSVDSLLTLSDNGDLAPSGLEQSDAILRVTPRVRLSRQSAGLRLEADAGAALVASSTTSSSRRDRVLPDARGQARLALVERLLFIDSEVDVRQVEENPFAGRLGDTGVQNTRTAATARISPYLDWALSPDTTAQARVDGIWTRYKDTLVGDSRTQRVLARVESRPRPIGWVVELGSEDTYYRDPQASDLEIDQAVATATAALGGEWVVGVAGGRERTLLNGVRETDNLVGARLYWVPGPRTDIALSFDRRFFGDGWNLSARHRTPQTAISLRLLREPATAGSGIRGDGLATFLDAILTTRNPDAAARAELVNDLIATRGLSGLPAGAISAVAAYPQRRSAADLTWVYLAPRTTVTLGAFAEERVQLVRDGDPPVSTADGDARQAGGSVAWNRRLTAQTGLEVRGAYARIAGLAAREGELAKEASLRVSLLASLSPQMSGTLGVLVRRVRTNSALANSFDENSAFAGLAYRF